MKKRLLNCQASDFNKMTGTELKQSILASEGRTICSELVVMSQPYDPGLTNAEVAKSFGADLFLLNGFDCFNPEIKGLPHSTGNPITILKQLIGRPVGVNLEPVDVHAKMAESRLTIDAGRICSVETVKKAEELGIDFICLTGNPGTGVTNSEIEKAIKITREHFSGMIIAGKMHGSGAIESVVPSEMMITSFVKNGADVILFPSVGKKVWSIGNVCNWN